MSRDVRAGGAYVELGLRSQVERGLQKVGERLRAFGTSATIAGAGMLAAATGMVAPLLAAASDAQETASKFNTVFGSGADQAREWGNTFAGEVGRSKQQIEQFMASSQDLFIPLGFDEASATEASKTVTKLAVDLASFNNISDADAMADLQAAMTGSGEVMKKYGVVLNEAGIKQELLNQAIDPKNATNAQKAQAALNIIMAGTAAAQGDAARTGDGYANQLKRLQGGAMDLAVALGNQLIGPATAVLRWLNSGAQAIIGFINSNQVLVRNILYLVAAVGAGGAALLAIGGSALVLGTIIPPIITAFGFLTSIIGALVGPVGIAIAVIAMIGAALWLNRDAVMEWASAFWDVMLPIRSALSQILSIVTETFGGVFDAIAAGDYRAAVDILWAGVVAGFYAGVELAMSAVSWLVDTSVTVLTSITGFVASWASTLFSPFSDAIAFVASLITSVFGGTFDWLFDSASDVLTSVTEMFGGIGNALLTGNIGLAAEILWASIKLAFVSGMQNIKLLWTGFVIGLTEVWDGMSTTIVSVFRGAIILISQVMQSALGKMRDVLNLVAEYDPTGATQVVADTLGTVSNIYAAAEDEMTRRQKAADDARMQRQIANGQEMLEAEAAANAKLKTLRDDRDALIAQANNASKESGGISGIASRKREELSIAKLRQQAAEAYRAATPEQTASVTTAQATAVRSANDATTQQKPVDSAKQNDQAKSNAGTFSAFGAALLGLGGNSVNEKIAKATEKTSENTGKSLDALQNIADQLQNIPSAKFVA